MARGLPSGMRANAGRYRRREKAFGEHLETAKRLFAEWNRRIDLGELDKDSADPQNLLDAYLVEKEGEVTERHLDSIDDPVSELLEMMGANAVRDIMIERSTSIKRTGRS